MTETKAKILVTGATGLVGRHVVAQLVQAGAAVRALTRSPGGAKLPEGVEVVHVEDFRRAGVWCHAEP